MVYKPIVIVAGEPNSIFSEILIKSLKYKKFKSPIILIASKNLFKLQMKKLNVDRKIRLIKFSDLKSKSLDNKKITSILETRNIKPKNYETKLANIFVKNINNI